jgi:sulfur carrier protein
MSEQSEAIKRVVTVNGSQQSLQAATIAELLLARALGVSGVAVALNGRVVPRAAWSATPLVEGDTVEIVRAMQGG